jgi:CelD/BcsL family acetyltransferase involved in cellulose biosynthesis
MMNFTVSEASMEVVRFSNLDELQAHQPLWDDMAAGIPFRSWTWLSTWWRHYAALGQLFVLGVFDRGHLIGIAPWYQIKTLQNGRMLRCLGDVEVCSEYVTILCEPGLERTVTDALAEWLLQANNRDQWDVIELASTDPEDVAAFALAEQMAERGCRFHPEPGPGCWRAVLPPSWDEYLPRLSKDRRKKIRRLQRRYIDSGLVAWHTASSPEKIGVARRVLVDLHQGRRTALGQPGCFTSPRYRAFHEEVMPRLLKESRLGLHWLEFDGRPVAAEYQLRGANAVYCYQGGISPDGALASPGQIAILLSFQQAIEQGRRTLDFLRGDEPYKRQWGAQFCPNVDLRIVAGSTAAQLRHGIWLAGRDVKQWVREAMGVMHLH